MPASTSLPDLAGRRAVVTGASGGIGLATARALAGAGADVVLAVRDRTRGERAAAAVGPRAEVRLLDLADLASVRAFAAAWDGPLDLLVNNAGVSPRTRTTTADGFETQLGVNHLGHFALTGLLLEHLTGRVVTVASQAERGAKLELDDLQFERRPYKQMAAYGQSKLANLLFTAELQRRLDAAGSAVRAMAAHPGWVATGMADESGALTQALTRRLAQSPDDGALPTLLAATGDLPGGTYCGPEHLLHMRGGAEPISRSKRAQDPALARALWEASERLTGVTYALGTAVAA